MILTTPKIRGIKPREKYFSIGDAKAQGLILRIAPSGGKTWQVNYRDSSRKWRRVNIGNWPEVSLTDARAKAAALIASVKAGVDPLAVRREQEAAPTMADLWNHFEAVYAPRRIALGRMVESTVRDYGKLWRGYVEPVLGSMKVADVSREHVSAMLEGLPPATRNKAMAVTSRLFSIAEELDWATGNPCRHVEKAREVPRDRVLSPSELAALSDALDGMAGGHPAQVAAIRVAAMTGLRISEVLGIRWADIETETGRLTIPASKTGRRMAFLPSPAMTLIDALPRHSESVFAIDSDTLVSYKAAWRVFRDAVRLAGIADCRIHDLRRTLATRVCMQGAGAHVLKGILGHASTRMAERYVRLADSVVNESAEAVGAEIAGLMGK